MGARREGDLPEITPAMLEAGMAAYAEREEGLGLDEDDILHIYRSMEAARQGILQKPNADSRQPRGSLLQGR